MTEFVMALAGHVAWVLALGAMVMAQRSPRWVSWTFAGSSWLLLVEARASLWHVLALFATVIPAGTLIRRWQRQEIERRYTAEVPEGEPEGVAG